MPGLRRALAAALLATIVGGVSTVANDRASNWNTIGHDPANSRDQPFERRLSPHNVDRLLPKWIATTTGDVSGTPAVADGAVYFGDLGGTLWKLDADTGRVSWSA